MSRRDEGWSCWIAEGDVLRREEVDVRGGRGLAILLPITGVYEWFESAEEDLTLCGGIFPRDQQMRYMR